MRPNWNRSLRLAALVAAGLLLCGAPRLRAQEDSAAGTPAEEAGAPADSAVVPQQSLMQMLKAGGVIMVPLFACSFVLLVFAFERAIALRRGRVLPRPFLKRFLHQLGEGQLDREQALSLCSDNSSPIATVFAAGVKKWGRPAEEIDDAVTDAGERAVIGLRKYLRSFNGVATISPLLGLLGTTMGMISAFNEIAASDAMGRPELLAAGISQALLTTAAGLSIAIPALALHLYFSGKADSLTVEMDALSQQLVELIAEGKRPAAGPRLSRREAA